MHDITSESDARGRIEGGVVDVFLEAREEGKVRHLGFSGHTRPSALIAMLELLEARGLAFDACQMPVNVVDPHYESFTLQVLPALLDRGYGILAMKTLVYGQLLGRSTSWRAGRSAPPPALVGDQLTLGEALAFVWSLPISTLISGMTNESELDQNASLCRTFPQLDEAQRWHIVARVASYAGPQLEFYKA
jgi:predicted aldo/keto reductase-like oxidoreductase